MNAEKLGLKCQRLVDRARVFISDTKKATELILAHPELFSDYEITKGDIDDVFLTVTGKKGGNI